MGDEQRNSMCKGPETGMRDLACDGGKKADMSGQRKQAGKGIGRGVHGGRRSYRSLSGAGVSGISF